MTLGLLSLRQDPDGFMEMGKNWLGTDVVAFSRYNSGRRPRTKGHVKSSIIFFHRPDMLDRFENFFRVNSTVSIKSFNHFSRTHINMFIP